MYLFTLLLVQTYCYHLVISSPINDTDTVKFLNLSMDMNASQCDLYNHVCGNFDDNFDAILEMLNQDAPKEVLKNNSVKMFYLNPKTFLKRALVTEKDIHKHLPYSVRNAQSFFNSCVQSYADVNDLRSTEFLTKTIRRFEEHTGLLFPPFHNAQVSFTNATPQDLGKAYGYVLGRHFAGEHLPFNVQVALNIREREDDPVYVIQLVPSRIRHTTAPQFKDLFDRRMKLEIKEIMESFVSSMDNVTRESINETVSDIIQMHGLLSDIFPQVDRSAASIDHVKPPLLLTVSEANERYDFCDMAELMKEFTHGSSRNIKEKIFGNGLKIAMDERSLKFFDGLQKLHDETNQRVTNSILFYSLIRKYWRLAYNNAKKTCLDLTMVHFGEALIRIYVDDVDSKHLELIRNDINEIAQYVLKSFDLQQFRWLQPAGKAAIRKKERLEIIALYSDVTKNDTLLEDYYHAMGKLDNNATYFFNTQNKVENFTHQRQLEKMLLYEANRREFDVEQYFTRDTAWYNQLLNAIVIPLPMLHIQRYELQRPRSMNFGGIGMVIGHEISHAFGIFGVHFDEFGFYHSRQNSTDTEAYDNLTRCLTKQYSSFCGEYHTRCVNGTKTLEENLADNAGLHAAFRAMSNFNQNSPPKKAHYYGQLDRYTEEELFFLGFASYWCTSDDAEYRQALIGDNHSPNRYRVLGAVRNLPAFSNMYKCETKYAPGEFCNIT
ncbi:peptidase family m13 domain-containing protein [Ditylenchus destructor]|nr:peptidase family m13 domain-containing protein [Ditylenchus destructor]